MIEYSPDLKIYLNNGAKKNIIDHCMRKFTRTYLPDETHEQQAYGLLGIKINHNLIYINDVYTCKLNYRNDPNVVNYINDLINKYAIPSDTPISQRGWVAKPEEVAEAHDRFDSLGLYLGGSYHMHHSMSWKGNQPKEYPSVFDGKLAENSNMLMLIISIAPERPPFVKAFHNGLKENEIEVLSCY